MATTTQNPETQADTPPADQQEQKAATAALAKPPEAPVTFDRDDPVSLYMDGGVFNQLQRVARLMTSSGLVPAHLRSNKSDDKTSDCFLVAAQAFRWNMDPFAVAQHTFVVSGKLGYEGKLVAAVVNSNPRTVGRLRYQYDGDGAKRRVLVSGRIKGEDEERTIEGTVGDWATSNENWKKSPDQMLAYRGAREWARRHMPEALIGIRAEEELEPVEMERAAGGGFQPRTISELTDKLHADIAQGQATEEPAAPAPAEPAPSSEPPAAREPGADDDDETPTAAAPAVCDHPSVPKARVAVTPKGKSVVCEDCGESIPGEAEPGKKKPAGQRRLEED